ncbi:MAG TPA: DUF222 domain-containing protein [Actinomycetaceae bacterium]|nr:DUF222 domain-containing protein [Actinomycetaceae bacterium]
MHGSRDQFESAGEAAKVGRELVLRPRAGLPVMYARPCSGPRDQARPVEELSPVEHAAAVSAAMRGVLETGYRTASRTLEHVAPLLDEVFFAPTPADRLALMGTVARLVNQANAALVRHAMKLADDLRFGFADRHSVLNFSAEEIGNALGIAPFTASRWIRAGRQVFGRLHETGDLFTSGVLSVEKICAISESLAPVPDPLAVAVQDEILPQAESLTPREIKREIAQLLVELDPDGADERHANARRRRYVSRLRPASDGMASFNVFMPADQATCVNTVLERSARAAKAAGDGRTHQELRTDTLASLAVKALREGTTITVGDHVQVPPTKIDVTVPLEVLARSIPEWAGHPSPLGRIHDEIMGAPDHATPTADISPRDGRLESAWLEGYGPIPPAIATLLAAGGTWRRIITDTLNGRPLDVGRATYRPPKHIAVAVALRDKTCSRPGCDNPAMYCEQDHLKEWWKGGTTALAQLMLLCRRCHRAKTLGAGQYMTENTNDRRFWKSPLGFIYSAPEPRPPRKLFREFDPEEHPGSRASDTPPRERGSTSAPKGEDRDPPPTDSGPPSSKDPGPPPF